MSNYDAEKQFALYIMIGCFISLIAFLFFVLPWKGFIAALVIIGALIWIAALAWALVIFMEG